MNPHHKLISGLTEYQGLTTSQLQNKLENLFQLVEIITDVGYLKSRTLMNKKIDDATVLWNAIVYFFDDKKALALYNNKKYFIDSFGNFYLNEEHFLLSLEITGTFTNSDNPKVGDINDVKQRSFRQRLAAGLKVLHGNSDILKNLLNSNGKEEEKRKEIEDKLLKILHINPLFAVLTNYKHTEIVIDGDDIFVKSANARLSLTENDYDVFCMFEKAVAKGVPDKVPYERDFQEEFTHSKINIGGKKHEKKYKNNLRNRFVNPDLGDGCRTTAIKILDAMPSGTIEIDEFKFLVFWVQFKCSLEFIRDALFFNTLTNNDIRRYSQEFLCLLKAVDRCRGVKHEFISNYSKAYHVNAHYTEIRDAHQILQDAEVIPGSHIFSNFHRYVLPTVLSLMPDVNINAVAAPQLRQCVNYYLRLVADFVFNDALYVQLNDNDLYYYESEIKTNSKKHFIYNAGQITAIAFTMNSKWITSTIYTAY